MAPIQPAALRLGYQLCGLDPRRRSTSVPSAPTIERRRQRLGGDQRLVRAGRAPAPRREPAMVSAIRSETSRPASRRACWTARTRSRARPSAASSGVTAGVEHDEAAARQHPGRGAAVAGAGDGLEGVLPLLQHQAARGDGAVLGHRPVARLRALDRGLHVLAQPRAGGAGVDASAAARRRTTPPPGASASSSRTDFTFSSSATIDSKPASARGVRHHDRQRRAAAAGCAGRRPCAAPSRPSRRRAPGPSPRPARRRRAASSAAGQSVRCTERSPVSPRQTSSVVSGSSGAVDPADRLEHGVERVERLRSTSPSAAQNRSRERRMYQFVSTSRNDRVESHALATS